MKVTVKVVVAGLLLFAATPAIASIIAIDDAYDANSWGQQFEEKGVGDFDALALVMTSTGDELEVPAMINFTTSGWSVVGTHQASMATKATPDTVVRFHAMFEGSRSNPLSFDFYAFNDEMLKESASAVWTGSGWQISNNSDPLSYEQIAAMVVPDQSTSGTPEPTGFAVWILLTAVCAGTIRRRR